MAHAEAYKHPGTGRTNERVFMANAVVALGGVIGIGLVIPLLACLSPRRMRRPTSGRADPRTGRGIREGDRRAGQGDVQRLEENGYLGATDTSSSSGC